jgi:hypothetical protein
MTPAAFCVPTCIVGTAFRGQGARAAIAMMRVGDEVQLEREPQNPHDQLAIGCRYLGRHVGYIPRQANPRIAAALDAGHKVLCVVREPPVVLRGVIRREPALSVSWEEA